MTEEKFWKCTPRRLSALSKVYTIHQNGNKDSTETPRTATGYIDQVL